MKRYCILIISIIVLSVALLFAAGCIADAFLSDETLKILDNNGPWTVTVQIRPDILMPFDQQRLETLNTLLEHVAFRICRDGALESISILMDGKEIISLTIDSDFSDKKRLEISVIPGKVYVSTDPLSLLQNSNPLIGNLSDIPGSDYAGSADMFINTLGSIKDMIPENTKTSDIKTRIGKYGTAIKKHILTVPQDQTDNLNKLTEIITKMCTDAHILNEDDKLLLSGKQQATDFRDAEGNCLRFQYSGKAGIDQDDMRNVSLDWKGRLSAESRTNELVLKTPAVKGNNRNNIVYKSQLEVKDGVETNTFNATYDSLKDRQRYTGKEDGTLTYERVSDGIHISGSVKFISEIKGHPAKQIKISPDLTLSADNESHGSIRIEQTMDKRTIEDVTFLLISEQNAQISWTEQADVIDIGQLDDTERDNIQNEISETIVSALIRPLIMLSDNKFISQGIEDSSWQNIIEAARM